MFTTTDQTASRRYLGLKAAATGALALVFMLGTGFDVEWPLGERIGRLLGSIDLNGEDEPAAVPLEPAPAAPAPAVTP